MSMDLKPTQVHIWFYCWERFLPGDVTARMQAIVSADERSCYERFRFEKDRQVYLIAHVLLRRVLSQYRNEDESAWQFAHGQQGKPFIVSPLSGAGLSFSLTHADGIVACAVSTGLEIGVDAENVNRRCAMLEIARSNFAPAELKHLENTSPPRQRDLFFAYWTLKEAYVKARGLGLSLPLQGFTLDLRDTVAPRISFQPGVDTDPLSWCLWLHRPNEKHMLAAAVRMARGAQFILRDAAELLGI